MIDLQPVQQPLEMPKEEFNRQSMTYGGEPLNEQQVRIDTSLDYCIAVNDGIQSIPRITETKVDLETFTTNNSTMSATDHQITVATTGIYTISYLIRWNGGSDFDDVTSVRRNNSTFQGHRMADYQGRISGNDRYQNISFIASLTAGEAITAYVYQNHATNSRSLLTAQLSISQMQ